MRRDLPRQFYFNFVTITKDSLLIFHRLNDFYFFSEYFKKRTFAKMRAQFQLTNSAMMALDTVFMDKLVREKLGSLIKSTHHGNSNLEKIATLKQSMKQKGLNVIQGIKTKNHAALSTFGQRMKNSKLFKLKQAGKIAGKTVAYLAQFASIGFGIWEIVDGKESMKTAGISSSILLKAKQLDFRMTSLISDYEEIVGK